MVTDDDPEIGEDHELNLEKFADHRELQTILLAYLLDVNLKAPYLFRIDP